ncbi:GNAT family N-acetyltransferase [Rhodopila sp.]|uniref:bifunctional acetate--CoA ligase family protein/GNAT family N-acetyltransferase n=1 Tax=Rhodopila sp. TaxID=2480087 RepID=UPI002CF358A5|nr:GNAT family N-acetyltransferase [Rhodopila sp.]HVZ09141.1 GNAT family N-acetyltransferase [Rhodopila sp.]
MSVPRLHSVGRFDPASLFNPKSVAVLGADSEAGSQLLANLALGGFKGDIHVPRAVADLPANTSLTVLALPEDEIGPAMQLMAGRNCHAAIVPGPCAALRDHADRTGVRALGAHSFGLVVPRHGLNAARTHVQPPSGRLGLISQSGALTRAVIDWAGPNGIGFSHIVGLGGNNDIGFGITLDWLSRDPGTGAILLDIRRIKDPRMFLSAARAAARIRPVVAIRAGLRLLDEDGSADRAFDAALRRAGVLCVTHMEDLLAAAETLTRVKPIRRDSVAIVSNAIGPARLAADTVLRHGLCLVKDPALDHGILHVPSERLAAWAHEMAGRDGLGAVLVVHAPMGPPDTATIAALCEKRPPPKAAMLYCIMGETTGAAHRQQAGAAGLAVFDTPTQAVAGFAHLVHDRRNREAARELPGSAVLALAPDQRWVRRIFRGLRDRDRLVLTQDEAMDVLTAYGIPVVPTRFAATPEDAVTAADLLGYPVVVKRRSTQRPAERHHGGMAFDLPDSAATLQAARVLAGRDSASLLVQRQVGRARELAVGVADDMTFGPIISAGAGGTLPSGHDVAADLPPLNLPLANALLRRCQAGASLARALRDRPAADGGAMAEVLVRVSQLIVDFPEIEALDIPSIFVDDDGVAVADAWLKLRPATAHGSGLAIAPYPTELVTHRVFGGEAITIRPIRPEDAEQHKAFFQRLSPEDIRYRFFSAVRELSPEQMARLTQVDYDREMAFIAKRDANDDTLGVARLVIEADGQSGEFAVIVQPDMKGRGLARELMLRLIDWARSRGLAEIVGQVLADNPAMLAFVRRLGFTVRRMEDEPDVMEVRLAT